MKAKRWHSQNIQELQKRRPGLCPALWQERQISYPSYLPSRAQSGPKFSASDSNAHSHQHGQVKCNLFASPVREFNVLSHIHARGFRTAERSIHEGLGRAVFWSGDGHWEGGLRFAPGLLTRPNLNLCNGNKTASFSLTLCGACHSYAVTPSHRGRRRSSIWASSPGEIIKTSVTSNRAYVITCYLTPLSISSVETERVITSTPLTIVQGERKTSLVSD